MTGLLAFDTSHKILILQISGTQPISLPVQPGVCDQYGSSYASASYSSARLDIIVHLRRSTAVASKKIFTIDSAVPQTDPLMASLIPSLTSCLSRMSSGEKRFARLLESKLEDDYLCWYEIPVGSRQRYTDFIILHPRRGLLLLEIKDWKLETIQKMDRQYFTLLTNTGLKRCTNPIEQVRQCSYRLVQSLEADPGLRQTEGQYSGKLACPYAFGVVLSNISRAEFEKHEFGEVLPAHLTICKDEMSPSVEAENFQEKLWNMFSVRFSKPLSLPQIDRVRWHLFPEIRIKPPVQEDLPIDPTPSAKSVDAQATNIISVMDATQERLARALGSGHRVIHGVAGSGKTLILGYHCQKLAITATKPILVLCFNVSLAARLREHINHSGIDGKVHVHHFHDWCGEQLKSYHVDRPPAGSGYVEALVKTVIKGVAENKIPNAQYGAVMIDEGHDFEPDWLKLIVGMVDPDSNNLLLLYDDAQALYSAKKELGFSLSSVGIQARGRTTVLRVNYRNTNEIIDFAYRFASEWLVPGNEDVGDDKVPLIKPTFAGRHGPTPTIRMFDSFESEAAFIAKCVHSTIESGTPPDDICITYRSKWMGKVIQDALLNVHIPVHWLKSTPEKKKLSLHDNNVKLMTMHSSKGLEFPHVIVAGTGDMPCKNFDRTIEAKLLYVAMTRATEKLLITSHKQSEFVERLAA